MDRQGEELRYVAGIDGGGSKTACMISDHCGHILSYIVTEGSNHQICGMGHTVENVVQSVELACRYANISFCQLSFIYMGMAGADLSEDVERLTDAFEKEFQEVPFLIENDRWNVFACESNSWGAVSVCGTGSSMAVKGKDGRILGSRALGYMLGNYGGGRHLTEIALHFAFRCDEHTGDYTRLAEELPGLCECSSMGELAERIYNSNYQYQTKYNIPKMVFQLAQEGDKCCRRVVDNMGCEIGDMLAHLICEAGLQTEAIPVVLAGSLYVADRERLLLQPLEERLRSMVPFAKIQIVTCPPVVGAVFMALGQIGINLDKETRRMMKTYSKPDYCMDTEKYGQRKEG